MLDTITVDAFTPAVGGVFVLDDAQAGRLELELVEARALESGGDGGGRAPFSLLFRGPGEPVLPQRIYPRCHDGLGRLEIFLVPVGRGPAGSDYEAIFT